MGKNPIVSVAYENEMIRQKNLTLHKMCVTSLLHVWSMGRFTAVSWVVL